MTVTRIARRAARHLSLFSSSSAAANQGQSVLFSRHSNGLCMTELNRPNALHALNGDMVGLLDKNIPSQIKEGATAFVIRAKDAADSRAICAGGDVGYLVKNVELPDEAQGLANNQEFFREEYQMDYLFYELWKSGFPIASFWQNGFLMGGGMFSLYVQNRVTGPSTDFAMPETKIGFFPDVGGSYFLPLLEKKPSENNIITPYKAIDGVGAFLALAGHRIKNDPASLRLLGLATHYVKPESFDYITRDLMAATQLSENDLQKILNDYDETSESALKECFIAQHAEKITHHFGGNKENIFQICTSLARDDSPFATQALRAIHTNSFAAAQITLAMQRESKAQELSFEQCLKMEYELGSLLHKEENGLKADFLVGFHGLKTGDPKWSSEISSSTATELVKNAIENPRHTLDLESTKSLVENLCSSTKAITPGIAAS